MKINYLFAAVSAFAFVVSACDTIKSEKNTPPAVDSTSAEITDTLKTLTEQLRKKPTDADLYYTRGTYFLRHQEYDNGLKDLLQAVSLDSSKDDYYIALSDVYFYTNKTRNSKKALEKAVSLDEKNVNALLKLAELHLYVNETDKSIEYINKVLKIDQHNAKAYFMKGMNYKDLRDTARAISSMQTAVEQDQTYYRAYMQLGLLHAGRQNPLAIQYYKNALRIQPKSTETLYALGKYYQDVNDLGNAIATYKTLLATDAKNQHACYNLGVIFLVELKDYAKALTYFSQAITLDSTYVEAYYARGLCYATQKDTEKAAENYRTCLAVNPNYEPAKAALKQLKIH